MSYLVVTDLAYLGVSVPLTAWVGRSLHRNGEIFLEDAFDGDERVATAVNRLLVLGFGLLVSSYVALTLHVGAGATDARGAVTALSVKIGLMLLAIGAMHLLNLYVLGRIRGARRRTGAERPDLYRPAPAADVPVAGLLR